MAHVVKKRIAKHQPCFTSSGAAQRTEKYLDEWQLACQLPGGIKQSWLVQKEDGSLQCTARRYQQAKTGLPAAKFNTL